MAKLISSRLRSQILLWQYFSIIAPSIFLAVAIFEHYVQSVSWLTILYVGGLLFFITCVVWWHWCLMTMVRMLSIMKDTDDHFENVTFELKRLSNSIKPELKVVTGVDKGK